MCVLICCARLYLLSSVAVIQSCNGFRSLTKTKERQTENFQQKSALFPPTQCLVCVFPSIYWGRSIMHLVPDEESSITREEIDVFTWTMQCRSLSPETFSSTPPLLISVWKKPRQRSSDRLLHAISPGLRYNFPKVSMGSWTQRLPSSSPVLALTTVRETMWSHKAIRSKNQGVYLHKEACVLSVCDYFSLTVVSDYHRSNCRVYQLRALKSKPYLKEYAILLY